MDKRNTIGRSNVFIYLHRLLIIFEYNMRFQKSYAHSIFILGKSPSDIRNELQQRQQLRPWKGKELWW